MAVRRSARLSIGSAMTAQSQLPDLDGDMNVPHGRKRKPAAESKTDGEGFTIPSTPKRKRVAALQTPTPATASVMGIPYSSADIDDTPPPPRDRLAAPHLTNAPLVSPQTSRLFTNPTSDSLSPSKASSIIDRSTTGEILEQALEHLVTVEPKLKLVVEKHPCHIFSPEGLAEKIDPFRSLASGIMGQQVSLILFTLC